MGHDLVINRRVLRKTFSSVVVVLLVSVGLGQSANADSVPYTSYPLFPGGWQEQEYPHRLVGRLNAYYSNHEEQCTAAVVGSSNNATITAAAHCFGDANSVPDYVEFLPGARDDVPPYDRWQVTSWAFAYSVTSPYTYSNDLDLAFATVCAVDSFTIEDAVGGYLGMLFNAPRNDLITALNYPGTGDIDDFGRQIITHSEFDGTDNSGRGPDMTRIGASPTVAIGGSSGGPYLRKFGGDAGTNNYVVAVTTANQTSYPDQLWGAYLGDEAEDAYDLVESSTPTQC